MDLLTPEFINITWVGMAFVGGFLMRLLRLPPMIGFLAAGFVLNFLGLQGGSLDLEPLADYGIILLLFTIGLKLDWRGLVRAEIWAGTTLHVFACVIFYGLLLLVASAWGLTVLVGLNLVQALLLGFGLSFSSTIFAVKILEEKGEMSALHGRVAIGILIMQDILAVLFVTFSKGAFPSPWALGLPLLLVGVRPIFFAIMDRTGHGELLILAGFFVAVVIGATSFSLVGLKPDLGALVFGVLVSGHPRAAEMSKALYGFKDLFLVAFFLKIGLYADLAWSQVVTALLLAALLPVKSGLYLLILSRFHLRARTVFLATLALANYSIFGLLVVSISVQQGWLGAEWLVVLSLALTFSFLLAAPLNASSHRLYDSLAPLLARLESSGEHPDEQPLDLGGAAILVFGMGRVGSGAYDTVRQRHDNKVLGLDFSAAEVQRHQRAGRQVILADATDFDFWQKVDLDGVRLVMLAMPNHQANMFALHELRRSNFAGQVTATAFFDDELVELRAAGAVTAYNVYAEAGAGYGQHICESMGCEM